MRVQSPAQLIERYPLSEAATRVRDLSREAILQIATGQNSRLLVVVGPCSLHSISDAIGYGAWLQDMRQRYSGQLEIVMRAYLEKPRTTVGWTGLIYDPWVDGSRDLRSGLELSRRILTSLCEMGLPVAQEILDPITARYFEDILSWAAIGARTVESQIHRQIASNQCFAVAFKNPTHGNLDEMLDAALAASQPHTYFSIDKDGCAATVDTDGVPASQVILRGAKGRPNYSQAHITLVEDMIAARSINTTIVVDASHENSQKISENQVLVIENLKAEGSLRRKNVTGIMLESHLNQGRQSPKPLWELSPGLSITDACLDAATTEKCFELLAEEVLKR